MRTFIVGLSTFVSIIGVLLLTSILIGFPVKWLWNWLMPVIFNLPEIGFWQAVGLYFFSGVLFKSTTTKG